MFLEKKNGEWKVKQQQDVWHAESEPH